MGGTQTAGRLDILEELEKGWMGNGKHELGYAALANSRDKGENQQEEERKIIIDQVDSPLST